MLYKTLLIFLCFVIVYCLCSYNFNTYEFHLRPIQGIIDTVFGGIILTLILFFVSEYVFNINLTGEWHGEESIEYSTETIDPADKIQYVFHLLQKGSEIIGDGEKISEDSRVNGHITFERKNRVRVNIQGHLQRNYFKKSTVSLIILEHGKIRESTTSYQLKIQNKELITGIFNSTAADAKGKFALKKTV